MLERIRNIFYGSPSGARKPPDLAFRKGPRLDQQFTSCFLEEKHFLIEEVALPTGPLEECNLAQNEEDTHSCEDTSTRYYSPAAVISCSHQGLSGRELGSHKKRLLKDEDFCEAYFENVVFLLDEDDNGDHFPNAEIRSILHGWGCNRIYKIHRANTSGILSEGPCFIHGLGIHRTWRLFPDIFEAFQLPLVQEAGSGRFIPVTYMWNGKLMIPVPSRLHYPRTAEKPLAGIRVGVKDVIDLEGVQTSAQCRAFLDTFPARSASAECMAKLISLGAVPVGKTKCTQFASSEQPTADWVEFFCPWNPRADGYLSPRGSSAGSGSAIAGYKWLDVGVGTDTGGSIRGPAAVMGLFAIRPTVGATSLKGVLLAAESMDTVGFICRSAHLFNEVTKLWFKPPKPPAGKELKTLLFPTDYWNQWPQSTTLCLRHKFVSRLESFLEITRVELSLAKRWEDDNPTGDGVAMDDFLQAPFMNVLWKTYWDTSKEFREEHKKRFGKQPYVDPVIQYCWKRGSELSSEAVKDARNRIEVYAKWLNESVLLPGHVMVYPSGDLSPFYRDTYRLPPEEMPPYDWSQREDHQASLAGLPALTFPIGQAEYTSKVTGQKHFLPVNMEIMGPKGSDNDLTDLLLNMMPKKGYQISVETGESAYKENDATSEDGKQCA